jgi:hypothetical protein
MFARSHLDLHNIRINIERVKKLSDNIIGVGPIGIGLDGLLGFNPILGPIYSAAAGSVLVWDGARARASATTLIHMSAILVIDTFSSLIPGAGGIIDALFTGHKWAANLLLKHMEETIYFEGRRADVKDSREYAELISRVRSGKEKRRVVFLGDLFTLKAGHAV